MHSLRNMQCLQQHTRCQLNLAQSAKNAIPVPNMQSVFHDLGNLFVFSLSGSQSFANKS